MKRALVFWFTGLSGSGKSTVADGVKPLLEKAGYKTIVLDGDEVRRRHATSLGFSEEDIKKNNSLIVGLCEETRQKYDVILVPIISPYAASRQEAKKRLGDGFYEIYFNADLHCV